MTAISRSQSLGLTTINGLPAHILVVHAVVVLVPLTALALIASLRTSVAVRLGWWLPALAFVAFASVVVAMNAGGWLRDHVSDTDAVRRHTAMGGQLWPFSAAAVVLSVVVWRRSYRAVGGPTGYGRRRRGRAAVVVGTLAFVVAVTSVVQVVRIGDSGSRAAWRGHFSRTALHRNGPS